MDKDLYPNFHDLSQNEKLGEDYEICAINRATGFIVMAPHGGCIEPGTSEIASSIAANDLSLYLFEGLKKRPPRDLHITSENFDEPQALKLVAGCTSVLAVHGRKDRDVDDTVVWIGGRNTDAREKVRGALVAAKFSAIIELKKIGGQSSKNICNRGQYGKGVQLEIPRTLRRKLIKDEKLLKAFCGAVRGAILS